MAQGTFGNPEVIEEELDILLIGGGFDTGQHRGGILSEIPTGVCPIFTDRLRFRRGA